MNEGREVDRKHPKRIEKKTQKKIRKSSGKVEIESYDKNRGMHQ